MPGFLLFMQVAYDGDTYIALPGGIKSIDWIVRCDSPVGTIAYKLTTDDSRQ